MTNKTQAELNYSELLINTAQLANDECSIGLVSLDALSQSLIGIHPYAVVDTHKLDDKKQQEVLELVGEHGAPSEYYVSELTNALVSAAQKMNGKPLKVKLSGADSHTRSELLGSELESKEINPVIGLRGVSRFAEKIHRGSFELECEIIKRARNAEGMANIELVIPFVRTLSESATIIDLLAEQGLCRGAGGLKVHLMCELPGNALLADKFLQYFDGIVIDIDQLGQFTLGLDQSNSSLSYLHDDQNEAVLSLVQQALKSAASAGKPCDVVTHFIHQAPKLQRWLLEHDVDTVICQ
jgi:phosphoenolpyruvate-protein phosphotransferase (PTS system enzyme I)